MLHGSGKGVRKQMLNFQVEQITDGTNTNICWVVEFFPNDIEEVLISDE